MKTMTKKSVFFKTIILSVLVLLFSCGQDPIFYTIKEETEPIPPRIPGSPTKIVVFKRVFEHAKIDINPLGIVPIMFVASGRLHWYAKDDRGTGASAWDSPEYDIPQPDGRIIDIAASEDYLYALSISNSGVTTTLRRIGPSENDKWENISINESKYTSIQTIFTAPKTGKLFAGANNNSNDYGILYLDDTDTAAPVMRLLTSDSGLLSGVASQSGFYYLSTRGKGVYKVTVPVVSDAVRLIDLEKPEDEKKQNRLFMGMIQLDDDKIITIERNGGTLFEVKSDGFKQIKYSNGDNMATGKYATGVLALWQQVIFDDNGVPGLGTGKILVVGIQGGLYSSSTASTSSYTHGYVEIKLSSDGSLALDDSHSNISPNITVNGYTERYTATIGKHPLNFMYQASPDIDANMTFFASTQTAGLWSYRNRDGRWQWNAEGANEP